jgi:hypothetical protein
MEGTLSYSARHKRLGQDRHASKHSHASRRHPWISQRKDRTETDSAEVPANQDARARPVSGRLPRSRHPEAPGHGAS